MPSLSFRIRRQRLRLLSVVALGSPSMGMRIWANRAKGVRMGERPWIGPLVYLDIHHSHPQVADSLVIGDHTAIGHGCSLFTHDSLYNQITDGAEPVRFGRVVLGDHVNVSPHSFLYNCTIGDHCVVAPGSVVIGGSYPAWSLIGGNPAKVLRDLSSRDQTRADPA